MNTTNGEARHSSSTCYRSYLFSLLILSIIWLPAFAFAQSEEEMQTLRMYFKEDELVTAPTRAPKPLSKVAENISIVTAEEIEAMNAHSLTEVLERVTGIYVFYMINDFFKSEFLLIEGAVDGTNVNKEERHVLLLLDGIPWNFMSNGRPMTNTIPVNIIKRLEIIKGPASSVWGSSLGGVINIVTKDTGDTTVPSGTVSASFGERNIRDYYGAVAGRAGIAGYYLYAGRQDSDGFSSNRYFERNSFYGKFDVPFTSDIKFVLTAGYSKPRGNEEDNVVNDYAVLDRNSALFATATLTAEITDTLSVETSLYELKQKFVQEFNSLSTDGLLYSWAGYEKKTGGSAKLVFAKGVHNAVLGLDVNRTGLDKTEKGEWMGETVRVNPRISKWAVFVNDTISIGDLSITPGIRYDKNNVNGDFTSPSLGVTYRLDHRTILRASAARGFSIVPLLYTEGETYSDPSLKPEEIWSYQAGVESVITEYLRVKALVFHHNMKDAIVLGDTKFINAGKTRRTGTELDIETAPFHDLSMKAGISYFRKKLILEDDSSPDVDTIKDVYSYHLVFNYNDMKSLSAQLAGNYTWWSLPSSEGAKYNTAIWDFNLTKNIYSKNKLNTEVFMTAHNIFNGSYYMATLMPARQNPRRWMEAGVRLKF
ncbi:MAG: TonB-dependent receptor [Nitrospirae bacterium]|nr:TonB-dependent receptor [Nitrospirota bacterium]